MPNIFEYTNYRQYLAAYLSALKESAHGKKGKWARAISVSSSLMSQILAGHKSLTPDQASALVDELGHSELEADYFILMVEHDRAATIRYRDKLAKKMAAQRASAKGLARRVPRARELSDTERAVFYSSWLYTAVFNLSALPELPDVSAIADHLKLEPRVVARVVGFLLENGLCQNTDGRLAPGSTSIHVDRDSPHVNKHHQNWRIQAIEKMDRGLEEDLFFTSPMSLSHEAAEKIRSQLPAFIQEIMKISGPSPSETAYCLNIDWFAF